MGAKQSAQRVRSSQYLLSRDDNEQLYAFYISNCVEKPNVGLTNGDMEKLFNKDVDGHLRKCMLEYYFHGDMQKIITYGEFIKLYTFIVKGTIDEKVNVLLCALGISDQEEEIPSEHVLKYLDSVVTTFLNMIQTLMCREFLSWISLNCKYTSESTLRLSENLCWQLVENKKTVTVKELEWWVMTWNTVAQINSYVYGHIFHIDQTVDIDEYGNHKPVTLFPSCCVLPKYLRFPSSLEVCDVLLLNCSLPKGMSGQWRRIYSENIHGISFNHMIDRIVSQGPTIIIVTDDSGYTFGGFAAEHWKTNSIDFTGNNTSFLFTLYPRLRIYVSSNDNSNFQYLNIISRKQPMGLGMGGQLNYFGLWIDADLKSGSSSETCSTFSDYQMLSGRKDFIIRNVEVWGVGKPPIKEPNRRPSSILGVIEYQRESGQSDFENREYMRRMSRKS